MFEIAKTATGYASTPTTLVSFNGADGANPVGSLIADANGDLFGTTFGGGANGDGTVFEIAKTATGYASTPTTLVSFNGANGADPGGGLIADANGDLFGTTSRAARTTTARCSRSPRPDRLRQHAHHAGQLQRRRNGAESLAGSLIADANGDLFGTTDTRRRERRRHGVRDPQDRGGYASTPTTLVSFNGANGARAPLRSDRRRQRRPVRHDHRPRSRRRDVKRRHGVRDRQDRGGLREHAHHAGQASTAPTARRPSAA